MASRSRTPGGPRSPSWRASPACTRTLDTMITSYKGSAIVVDEDGRYESIVDFGAVLQAIEEMRPEENRVGESA